MNPTLFNTMCMSLALSVAAASQTTAADIVAASGQQLTPARAKAMSDFKAINTQSNFSNHIDGRIGRVYGKAFSTGATTQSSARNFINQHIDMWGLTADELIEKGPFADGHHTQLIGYMPEVDAYKFTGHYYTQVKQGVPVFRSKLVLLVRNQENNPLVLASSALHDLSAYQPDAAVMRLAVDQNRIIANATNEFKGRIQIIETERVIFAGSESDPHAPVLADSTMISIDGFQKYQIVTDASTGEIIFQENLIHTLDIVGNASAMATEGIGADFCEAEVLQPLPHLWVQAGGVMALTDVNGDFTIANPGVTPINVTAGLSGKWFEVSDFLTSVTSDTETVTPPGPANLVLNPLNNDEIIRSQVNAYIEANKVRDFAVAANPSYPTLQNESFPIVTNRTDGFCPGNAWYDPQLESINFCLSGAQYPNTAWSSVVQHEYGHHLVNAGGSGQGQYGEGMGDVMSTIILDDPRLGQGFFGSCAGSLRNADNNMQYPCNDAAHTCGQLISGCVWSTREVLVVTEPANYTQILNYLAVNSILVHSGSTISPQITIDWLTLDDDDANIGNGTPHYAEIAAGFGAHNMDAPELTLVNINPVSLPVFVSPDGTSTSTVEITNVAGTLDPTSPTLMVDTGSGFNPYPMSQLSATEFMASFPSSDCGSEVNYYITAQDVGGTTQVSPQGAPLNTYSAISAGSASEIVFSDNAETDLGWVVSGDAGSSASGRWERAIPGGDGSRGDNPTDFDGSGRCFVTGNGSAGSNTDVDGGSTILTSPVMDASNNPMLSYARWYDNTGSGTGAAPGADTFVVQVSDNAGSSWVTLETVGPNSSESSGGWFTREYVVADIPGIVANNQFRVRFTASDNGDGSVIEAAVDSINLLVIDCSTCPADLSGDGTLDFFDVSAFLSAFSAGNPAADFTGDGIYNFFDVSAFLSAFSAGCP